jgi:SET domain-containing protein
LENGWVIVPKKNEAGDYPLAANMNHHCQPNAQMIPWSLPEQGDTGRNGRPSRRLVCQAIKDIAPQQELFWSYMDPLWDKALPDGTKVPALCRCTKYPDPHPPEKSKARAMFPLVPQ